MLNASISILCRNLTTGASSTSLDLSAASVVTASAASSSNSTSPTMFSIASVTDLVCASTRRLSLSNSAMTQSTPICVANLIFSAAC